MDRVVENDKKEELIQKLEEQIGEVQRSILEVRQKAEQGEEKANNLLDILETHMSVLSYQMEAEKGETTPPPYPYSNREWVEKWMSLWLVWSEVGESNGKEERESAETCFARLIALAEEASAMKRIEREGGSLTPTSFN
jgi:hypothetical protein